MMMTSANVLMMVNTFCIRAAARTLTQFTNVRNAAIQEYAHSPSRDHLISAGVWGSEVRWGPGLGGNVGQTRVRVRDVRGGGVEGRTGEKSRGQRPTTTSTRMTMTTDALMKTAAVESSLETGQEGELSQAKNL